MVRSEQVDTFSRFTQVSRETITSLKKYEKCLTHTSFTVDFPTKFNVLLDFIRHFSYFFKLVIVSREKETQNMENSINGSI